MAELKVKARGAQDVQALVFKFNFDDTMKNKAGVLCDFGLVTVGAANVFEIARLPKGSRVVGGSFERLVAFDTAAYTVLIGDSSDTDRYLASADLKATGAAALLQLVGTGTIGDTVEMSIANTDVCTTGQGRVTILYVVDDKAEEVSGRP